MGHHALRLPQDNGSLPDGVVFWMRKKKQKEPDLSDKGFAKILASMMENQDRRRGLPKAKKGLYEKKFRIMLSG